MSAQLPGSGIMQRVPDQPAAGGLDRGQTDGFTYRNGANDWAQFFGPTKGPIETAPYGSYRRENFALPDAYRGSNLYLTNVIITLVTEQAGGGGDTLTKALTKAKADTRPLAPPRTCGR